MHGCAFNSWALQEWYDVSKEFFANLQRHGLPSPYKEDEDPSPFRALLGDDPSFAKPDPAHTYAIDGWGKSLCASGLILIYRLKIIKGRSLQVALDEGFEMFKAFCLRTGKQSSICYFAMKTLRIDAIRGTIHAHPFCSLNIKLYLCVTKPWKPKPNLVQQRSLQRPSPAKDVTLYPKALKA